MDLSRTLAAAVAPARSEASGSTSPSPAPLVCLISSNTLWARDFALQLRCLGYHTIVTAGAEHPQLLPQSQALSCLIVDEACGNETLLQVDRLRQLFGRVPLVWITPTRTLETRLMASRARADAVLPHPIDLRSLATQLNALITGRGPQRPRALVVATAASDLTSIRGALVSQGIECVEVDSPVRMFQSLQQQRPEVVILVEVEDPFCSAEDLTRLIRQDTGYLDLPVLVLSPNQTDIRRRRLLEAGADDVLSLNAQLEDLALTIKARLGRASAIRTLTTRDALTGLYNRRSVQEYLEREVSRVRREKGMLALAVVDLDCFKHINDNYGHAAGDEVLRAAARVLRQRLRREDIAGRFGGEEFVVVMPATSAAAAVSVLDEIRAEFERVQHRSGNSRFNATFSAGVADLDGLNALADSSDLFNAADKALYQAKRTGRNRIVTAERT